MALGPDRPKAIVTGISRVDKAKVVLISTPTPPREFQLPINELQQRALEMDKKCREIIGVDKEHGFFFNELQQCVDELKLGPTAVVHDSQLKTWRLLQENRYDIDRTIVTYSPIQGFGSQKFTRANYQLFYFPGDGTTRVDWLDLDASGYKLRPEPLQIPPFQTTPAACGPGCLFARTLTTLSSKS